MQGTNKENMFLLDILILIALESRYNISSILCIHYLVIVFLFLCQKIQHKVFQTAQRKRKRDVEFCHYRAGNYQ